ncbi:hypothetical protein BFR77_15405 [Acinetobacter pittii]|jgi:hypothetical protein|uniref:hypothetical protein n=1 Tax=Acinetobacter calcoaceticus/baumannii complex TaxID=909768 RepID=UPI000837FAA2|nr:hypothetical protein [Acinetobacter pittii]TDM62375.1 hypothetical protein C5B72_13320 [Acinetobacter sp. KU 011TH]TDM62604.1 hypothetical protein C4608_13330 [Acinetobacter sp. KU 013TH]MBN6535938.1 hypothetical protein [Acinetobacter pittii]OCY38124.1 hypothetical protein BFR77_15405 [Acinetobacter pittii]RZG94396.1 hypothetical protein EXE03_16065 [Acinetobacter pittii]
MTSLQEDKKIIADHGGASELARKLKYRSHRVQNWTVRGIPPKEKLKFPEIFLTPKTEEKNASVV